MIEKAKTREVPVPSDLRRAIAESRTVSDLWNNLTPIARRDFVTWVEGAKQDKTRQSRIGRVGSMLKSGKRRPCCFAVVPVNLYTALNGTPRAKATWSTLSPDERRDFAKWIESAGTTAARRERVEKSVLALAGGKRKP